MKYAIMSDVHANPDALEEALKDAHGSHGNANGDKLFSLYRVKCLEQELQKLHYAFAVLKLLGSYRQTM
jgi:hypothetical protein